MNRKILTLSSTMSIEIDSLIPKDDQIILKALKFAREEHEKIMQIFQIGHQSKATRQHAAGSATSQLKDNPHDLNVEVPSKSSDFGASPLLNSHRRLLISGIPIEITEADLERVLCQFGPVRSVSLVVDFGSRRHKGSGTVDFDTPEGASMALANMDGVELGSPKVIMRLTRPNGYTEELPMDIPPPIPSRLYVCNIDKSISLADILRVFSPFGSIRSIYLSGKSENSHKSTATHSTLQPLGSIVDFRHDFGTGLQYAYVEYEAESFSQQCINFFGDEVILAQRRLRVGRTVVGGARRNDYVSPSLGSGVNESTTSVAAATDDESVQENCILLLRNMFANVGDVNEAEELMLEVKNECLVHGHIIKCIADAKSGTIEIHFKSFEDAERMRSIMDGRWFDGRRISAMFK